MKGTMKQVSRIVGALVLSATLATGASVANAAPSHAATYGSPYKVQTGGKYCPVFMRITSINFWDWLAGKRVGQAEYQYTALC